MRINRINEDFLDDANDTDVVTSADIILHKELKDEIFCRQIDEIVAGNYPDERPNFENASDSIYPVDNKRLWRVIINL